MQVSTLGMFSGSGGFGFGQIDFAQNPQFQQRRAEMETKLEEAGLSFDDVQAAMKSGGPEAVKGLMAEASIEPPEGFKPPGGFGGFNPVNLGNAGGFGQISFGGQNLQNQIEEILAGAGLDLESLISAREEGDTDTVKNLLLEAGLETTDDSFWFNPIDIAA